MIITGTSSPSLPGSSILCGRIKAVFTLASGGVCASLTHGDEMGYTSEIKGTVFFLLGSFADGGVL